MSEATPTRTDTFTPLVELNAPLELKLAGRNYTRQYAALYFLRLRKLKAASGRLRRLAREHWLLDDPAASASADAGASGTSGKSSGKRKEAEGSRAGVQMVERVLDIRQGEMTGVCGTVYCSMRLKPDVLEDLTREQYLPPVPTRTTYADRETDECFLEDETGRVRLVGDGPWRQGLVTGVVCAVLGTETKSGDFDVADVVFPGLPTPTDTAGKSKASADADAMDVDEEADEWVALASGLEVGEGGPGQEDWTSNAVKGELLAEWLRGEIGSDEDRARAARITTLVLAGNSCAPPPPRATGTKAGKPPPFSTAELDGLLEELCSALNVHILPGARDPASLALPQQPIHRALLPRASAYEGCKSASNPAWCGVGECKLLGTAGQNIDDLFKYVEGGDDKDRLAMACRTLDWGHVAPTAPDTLWCFPFTDRDPFLIEQAPDIYFIGCQPSFQTTLYNGPDKHQTRVVLIPNFAQTGQIVLVNTRTLETRCVEIAAEL